MRRSIFFALCLAAAATGFAQSPAPSPVRAPGSVRFEPFTVHPRDGSTAVPAEFGWLTVLENRSRPAGPTIELAFIRFRTPAAHPSTPVVWLAGGPGGSGTQDAEGPILPLILEIRKFSDVIALDQRGMGRSQPRLDCPGRLRLTLDRPMERELVLAAFRAGAAECRAYWSGRGVDLGSFNTAESAHDLEDLRKALEAPRVSLVAGSYGTHLALATIRLFEGSIERAVMFGVQGPDHMERLPGDYEEVLGRIHRMVRGTPLLAARMPNFIGTVKTVLGRLENEPIRVEGVDPGNGEQRAVTLGKFDLQCFTRNQLVSRHQISRLPGVYLAMMRGDFHELASSALASRRGAAPPAVDFTMRCASGGSPARREKARAQSASTLLGSTDFPIPDICDAWGVPDLGKEFRSSLSSRVPVLFVSGTLDAHTPAANAREVLDGFPNGKHVLVEDGTHYLLGFSLPKGRKLAAKFLRGEPVSTLRLSTGPFSFRVPGLGRDAAIAAEFGRAGRFPVTWGE